MRMVTAPASFWKVRSGGKRPGEIPPSCIAANSCSVKAMNASAVLSAVRGSSIGGRLGHVASSAFRSGAEESSAPGRGSFGSDNGRPLREASHHDPPAPPDQSALELLGLADGEHPPVVVPRGPSRPANAGALQL